MKKYVFFLIIFLAYINVFSQIFLGFDVKIDTTSQKFVVSKVFKGSVAESSGLKYGDTIEYINGKKVNDFKDIKTSFSANLDKYSIVLSRYGKQIKKQILVNRDEKVYLGLILKKSNEGVIISKIIENSPASNSDLKEGDIILKVNEKPVKYPKDISEIINYVGYGKSIKILVRNRNIIKNKRVTLFHWILPKQLDMQSDREIIQDLQHIINFLEERVHPN